MCGVDELYVIARRVLLDALEALGPHRDATILVGAQAIYLHTGDAELALDPELLDEIPPLEQALQDAGFLHMSKSGVGVWKTSRPDRGLSRWIAAGASSNTRCTRSPNDSSCSAQARSFASTSRASQ